MDPISYPWLVYLSAWGVWLALVALKSLLILLFLEGALAVFAKSFSASARHTFRLLGLLALLLLLPLSLGVPKWNLSLLERPALLREALPGDPAQLRRHVRLQHTVSVAGQTAGEKGTRASSLISESSKPSVPIMVRHFFPAKLE